MIRKLMTLGILLTFLTTATAVFAEDVFVTARGSKYHKEICRLIKDKENVTKLDKKEAIEEDYGPCKRCFKEDAVSENGSDPKK